MIKRLIDCRFFLHDEAGDGDGGGAAGAGLLGGVGAGGGDAAAPADPEGGRPADPVGDPPAGEVDGDWTYDPTDEGRMKAWRERLGLGDEMADDYVPGAPEGVEEAVWKGLPVGELAQYAHRMGVPKEAFQGLVSEFVTREMSAARSAQEEHVASVKKEVEGLRGRWGRDFETNVAAGSEFARRLCAAAGVDVAAVLGEPALRDNVAFARLMAEGARMFGDTPRRGEGGVPSSAKEEMRAMMRDKNHRYHTALLDRQHPKHKEANDYYNKLMTEAAGK